MVAYNQVDKGSIHWGSKAIGCVIGWQRRKDGREELDTTVLDTSSENMDLGPMVLDILDCLRLAFAPTSPRAMDPIVRS